MIARPAIALRKLAASDVPACAALLDRVQRASFPWDEAIAYGPDAFLRSTAGEETTLAWAGHRLVGFVSVYPPETFVHSLFVELGWQGNGIGRRLLAAGLAGRTCAARLKCKIGSVAAQRFYERLGWREVARSGHRLNDWILYLHEPPGQLAAPGWLAGVTGRGGVA